MELALKRRSPFKPRRIGRLKSGLPKRLAILDVLQHRDCLLKPYIIAYLSSPQYTEAAITDLHHELGQIGVPEDAEHHINVFNRPVLYQITKPGITELKRYDRYIQRARDPDQFPHKYLRCLSHALLELAPKYVDGLRYLDERAVLANPDCPASVRAEKFPSCFAIGNHVIEPDLPLFAYTYGGAYTFFLGEVDRGTEQGKLRKDGKKTLQQMLQAYAAFFEQKVYKTRWGIPQCRLLIFTNNETRKEQIKREIRAICKPAIAKKFAIIILPDYKSLTPPPPPSAVLVQTPCDRVGAEPLVILDLLKSHAPA